MENTKKSLYAKLNSIIDTELEKESSDTDLILECCDAILRLKKEESYQLTKEVRDANIEAILHGNSTNKPNRRIIKVLLVAAIIIALLICSVFAYTIIEYKIHDYDTYSTVWANIMSKKIDEPVVVSYVPEGFELVDIDDKKYTSTKVYSNGQVYLTVCKTNDNAIKINTEYEATQTISIDAIDYVFYGEKKHGKGVVWTSNNCMYLVSGAIEDHELLKIAQSVS